MGVEFDDWDDIQDEIKCQQEDEDVQVVEDEEDDGD